MKIKDIVDTAKAKFSVLLTEDPKIAAYLLESLTMYQDLAGCIRRVVIKESESSEYALPEHYLAHAMCKDVNGDYVPVETYDTDDGSITMSIANSAVYPVTLSYFVHLAYYADKPDLHIPNRVAGMIARHLECLIGADNNNRIALVEAAGKMDTSRIPTPVDYVTQRDGIEEQFRANREIIPMLSIHPV